MMTYVRHLESTSTIDDNSGPSQVIDSPGEIRPEVIHPSGCARPTKFSRAGGDPATKKCNGCLSIKPVSEFGLRKKRGKKGQVWIYPKHLCKACESKCAVVRNRERGNAYETLKAWATRKYGSLEAYRVKSGQRSRRKQRLLSAGLTVDGTPRKPARVPDLEKKWDKLAEQNARQAFDYWFRVRATDAQIAAWFAGAGMPWANPRLTAAEKYRLRYRGDPEFSASEQLRRGAQRHGKRGRIRSNIEYGLDHETKQYLRAIEECVYCGNLLNDDRSYDHIKPLSVGGEHGYSNLIPAHLSCNLKKRAKTLLPFMFPDVFKPREVRHG